jgi:hypothetical protein
MAWLMANAAKQGDTKQGAHWTIFSRRDIV